MDLPAKQERNADHQKSKDDELSSDQVPVGIRQLVSDSEREEINNFVEKLTTDVKFEIMFLVDMINYTGNSNKEYPFKSLEALEDFTQNWIRMNIPKMEMLTLLTTLKENHRRRAKQRDKNLIPLDDDDNEAFVFGTAIWGSMTEDEYSAAEVKNTKKKSQVEGPGTGQDQDPIV